MCFLDNESLVLCYEIPGGDFTRAGEASSNVKRTLTQLGVRSDIVKRASIAMDEAELNAVIHANGGIARVEIDSKRITINIRDSGPGIADVELAMKEGYTTAPDAIREMGFGAGMGLPNMKKYSDRLIIDTEVGKGTSVTIEIDIK